MVLVQIGFAIIFAIGAIFIIVPIVGRLAISVAALRRSRFYEKRRQKGRVGEERKSNYLSNPYIEKLDEYLSVAEVKIAGIHLIALSLVFLIVAFLISYKIMPSPTHNLVIALLFATVPFLWLWSRYQKKTLAMASVMMPTVQNFIGYFSDSDNLEGAIYRSSRTVPLEIKSEWDRLVLDLQTGEKPIDSLLQFADRVGNDWAQYFVDILITHIETGSDITPSLFKLINEMQNAMHNEEKRITLLTAYKWGTLVMVGLSIFVVFFNIRMDPDNEYYYFHDRTGVQVVTMSVIVLFISFIGALQMGRKRL